MTKKTKKQIFDSMKSQKEVNGYYVHCVENNNFGFSEVHSHYVSENFGYSDLQIILTPAVDQVTASYVIHQCVSDDIKYDSDPRNNIMIFDRIINRYVRFHNVTDHDHGDRKFLRIIVADDNEKFPWDEGCMEEYKIQYNEEIDE